MSNKSNPLARNAVAPSTPETVSSRRKMLKFSALASAMAGAPALLGACASMGGASGPVTGSAGASGGMSPSSGVMAAGWDDYPSILARIQAPTFPARDFTITQYGAVAGGTADASEAIAKAIAACNAAGGGRVVVPAGIFLTGPITLKSNVNLHVSEGATLRFHTDPAKYPTVFTRWEGIECMNYSPLIYAFEQENIAVTGKGTLDGQGSAEHWWSWKGPWRGTVDGGWRSGMPDQRPGSQLLGDSPARLSLNAMAASWPLVRRGRRQRYQRRTAGRVRYQPTDPAWFAALAPFIPRRQWAVIFPVTPPTLLAWHRRLAARKLRCKNV